MTPTEIDCGPPEIRASTRLNEAPEPGRSLGAESPLGGLAHPEKTEPS